MKDVGAGLVVLNLLDVFLPGTQGFFIHTMWLTAAASCLDGAGSDII